MRRGGALRSHIIVITAAAEYARTGEDHVKIFEGETAAMNDAIRKCLAGIGRKGGKVGGKIGGPLTSPMKVAAARENDKNGRTPKESPSK